MGSTRLSIEMNTNTNLRSCSFQFQLRDDDANRVEVPKKRKDLSTKKKKKREREPKPSILFQESSSVSIDLFTYDDLESLRQKRQNQCTIVNCQSTNVRLANKRYLILTYNAEYDRIYYPLSLPYCGKPDPAVLMQQIRQLKNEKRILKCRVKRTSFFVFISQTTFIILLSSIPMLNEVILFVFNESKNFRFSFIVVV